MEVANVAVNLHDPVGVYLRLIGLPGSFLNSPLLKAAILAIFIAYDFYEPE